MARKPSTGAVYIGSMRIIIALPHARAQFKSNGPAALLSPASIQA
jgi:hypothetical protein